MWSSRRSAPRDSQELIDPARVIFIDETWAKTNMTRTYGRSESRHSLGGENPLRTLADDDLSRRIAGRGIHRSAYR